MGGTMTWGRMCRRNRLMGGYEREKFPSESSEENSIRSMIAGDLRRIEQDMRSDEYIVKFAAYANISEKEARMVINAFFNADNLSYYDGTYTVAIKREIY